MGFVGLKCKEELRGGGRWRVGCGEVTVMGFSGENVVVFI